MTFPDAFADDRWTVPTWVADRGAGWSWRLSDWVEDPLERAMLVAIAVLGAVLLWMLAFAQDASGMSAHDACVLTAVDEARAFAGVMGDERVVPMSFAVRSCSQQLG